MRVVKSEMATLYLGDCLEIMPTLEQVDAVITDPPYGIGFTPSGGSRARNGIAGGKKFGHFKRVKIIGDDKPFNPSPVLALNKPTILFGANHYANKLPPSRSWLCWDKRCASGSVDSFSDMELAWSNLGHVGRMFRHHWQGMMRASEVGVPRVHSTQKPILLMKFCIGLLPENCNTILDPFAGSGTTGVAAIQLGRKFIGIEKDPEYFEIMCQRIKAAEDQLSLFTPEPEVKAKTVALDFSASGNF